MVVALSPFQPIRRYGYGCKIWIAREIEENYFGGMYYVWFSQHLNPLPPTARSSNPLELYSVIDQAVKIGDVAEPKIKDLRANIRVAINLLVAPGNAPLARALRRAVQRAPLDMFRPQLWRLDLSKLAPNRVQPGKLNWDEWLIQDVRPGEFEVIVE